MGSLSLSSALTLALAPRSSGGGVAPAAANLSIIDATGWSGTADPSLGALPAMDTTGLADFTGKTLTLVRQGFNSSGAAITNLAGTRTLTKRLRQPFPNQATATTATITLDDYVYSTDTIAGCTNGSGETSPVPLAAWAKPDHVVIGNSLPLEVVAFHREGKDYGNCGIAAVVFSATDGTTTVTATASTASILGHSGDLNPVIGFAATIDTTTLNNAATITVNAKVYPFVGGAGSVLDSAGNTPGTRTFAPQIFLKNTTLAANPRYAYVSTTGVDASGVTSTTAATAAASPFLTIKAAVEKLKTDATLVDGCIVRIGAGSFALAQFAAGTYQGVGELVIERDPAATSSTAIITGGASAITLTGISWLRVREVTFQKTGASFVNLVSGGAVAFENAKIDTNGFTTLPFARTSGTMNIKALGLTVNTLGSTTLNNAISQHVLMRGVSAGAVGGSISIDAFAIMGSIFKGVQLTDNTNGLSGTIVAFNQFLGLASPIFLTTGNNNLTGYALVQNVLEWMVVTNNPTTRLSADGATSNMTHVIEWHNTFAGAWNAGRFNNWYDETDSVNRAHKLNSSVGNIHVSPNIKQDVLHGVLFPAQAPTHIGGWSMLMGVGMKGEFFRYADSTGNVFGTSNSDRNFNYPGSGAKSGGAFFSGASAIVQLNPLFTTPAHTTVTGTNGTPAYTAGAGAGVYTLQVGSPAKAMVVGSPVPIDGLGVTRSATSSAGYVQ